MTDNQEERQGRITGPLELVVGVVVILTIAGIPLFLVAWIIYPSHLPSSVTVRVGIGLAAWILLVPISWLLTRRPKRNGWFLGLIIAAAGGFPAFGFGSLGVVNALFDGGAAKPLRVQVLGRRKLTGQSNSHPYRLIVRGWLPGIDRHEIIVERDLWHTNPGQVIVLEKPGLLGWPWVDEVRPATSK